jgi:uncharacterized protein YraI
MCRREGIMELRSRLAKFAQLAICAGALVALSAEFAAADPARVISNANLRLGPGTNYGIATTIPAGSTVDVSGCAGEWCTVRWNGRIGYAVTRNLDLGGPGGPIGPAPVAGPYPPPAVVAGPPVVVMGPPPVYWGPGYYYGPRWGWGWRRW